MIRKKGFVIVMTTSMLFVLTACGAVKKIEKETKMTETKSDANAVTDITAMNFEKKSIAEIKESAKKSMSVLGTDDSKYGNIASSNVVPIITDKEEIYNLKLNKSDGNDIEKPGSFNEVIASKRIDNVKEIYRNDMEGIKQEINMAECTDAEHLIEYIENYMNTTYIDSPFKWVVEYLNVNTSSDKKDYIGVSIRPSYDGVVFTRTLVMNDGLPVNDASDFRGGLIYITEMNNIQEYYGISPYYEVEKQGDAITDILSIESVLSIVANKIDKESISEIKLFELAYKLKKDLTAVPIWSVTVVENGEDRNFQIDAVTGDVYFE